MRPCITATMVALLLGIMPFSSPFSSAQEQSEGKRKVVSQVVPAYPEIARRLQIHGTVKVEVIVAPNGKVKAMKVIGGHPVLASAAVDAIAQWKWAPAAQESQETVEINFNP